MDSALYKELSLLTKSKERWEENIPYVTSLLNSESTKIKAKIFVPASKTNSKFILVRYDKNLLQSNGHFKNREIPIDG